jgi:hypothetical protein
VILYRTAAAVDADLITNASMEQRQVRRQSGEPAFFCHHTLTFLCRYSFTRIFGHLAVRFWPKTDVRKASHE